MSALVLVVVLFNDLNVQSLKGAARIVDGDSLRLNDKRLRLLGIDAPELNQNCKRNGVSWKCGREAKTALLRIVGPDLECAVHGDDRYGRQLVICWSRGVEVNAEMVAAGWAVDYGGYAWEEREAKNTRKGLWAGSFVQPQDWRRERRLKEREKEERELANSMTVYLRRWLHGVFN